MQRLLLVGGRWLVSEDTWPGTPVRTQVELSRWVRSPRLGASGAGPGCPLMGGPFPAEGVVWAAIHPAKTRQPEIVLGREPGGRGGPVPGSPPQGLRPRGTLPGSAPVQVSHRPAPPAQPLPFGGSKATHRQQVVAQRQGPRLHPEKGPRHGGLLVPEPGMASECWSICRGSRGQAWAALLSSEGPGTSFQTSPSLVATLACFEMCQPGPWCMGL